MTFRRRIIVAMLPLFALLVVLGGTATVLIYRLGNGIDEILRENYDSVIAMRDLNEALERIDSSFQFALGRARRGIAPSSTRTNWKRYEDRAGHRAEQHHPARRRRTGRRLTESDRRLPPARRRVFHHAAGRARSSISATRNEPGFYGVFREIKTVSGEILQINQDNMERCQRPRTTDGPLVVDLVRRRIGDRHRPGHVSRGQHDPHDPASDPRGDRIGHGHRRGQSRSTRSHLLGRRVGRNWPRPSMRWRTNSAIFGNRTRRN